MRVAVGAGMGKRWALLGVAGCGLFLALAVWTPHGGRELSWCVFRRLTGVPCAGCGLTRSVSALAHGHLAESLRLHPLGLWFTAQAGAGWALWGLRLRRRGRLAADAGGDVGFGTVPAVGWLERLTEPEFVSRWLLGNAAALVALWVVRLLTGTLPF